MYWRHIEKKRATKYKTDLFTKVILTDIDECTEDNPCKENQQCINTLGSYRCQPRLICNIGYEMNEGGTQCIGKY